tara:strand:+ start:368 stop:691 length:324 start_codon:yes stop_codon:yes gene_type:complete
VPKPNFLHVYDVLHDAAYGVLRLLPSARFHVAEALALGAVEMQFLAAEVRQVVDQLRSGHLHLGQGASGLAAGYSQGPAGFEDVLEMVVMVERYAMNQAPYGERSIL